MLYHWYELGHAAVKPARAAADSYRMFFNNPFNPLSHTAVGRHAAAACEVFERTTRRYHKPAFDIPTTRIGEREIAVHEQVVWQKPFCRLLHFARDLPSEVCARDPRILVVAPMSGHYATLLRGTIEELLPNHEVFITDWTNARDVPVSAGRFDLDDYIDYLIEMLHHLNGDAHLLAICQPSVPALAATAIMEAEDDPCAPRSLILAGGPIDTRISPTAVNQLAQERGTDWFRSNVIETVPWPSAGFGRAVYPGFLQLTGFMTMNLDRHVSAHNDLFHHLVTGDGNSAAKHRAFYDEYLAVMDLTAEFYLQTIDAVFVRHSLAKGQMRHRGRPIDTNKIRSVGLMTIEGEKDDITGLGQCRAAHNLTPSLGSDRKFHLEVPEVGHYGIFNGSRFRSDVAPRIAQFVRCHDPRSRHITTMPVDWRKAAAKAQRHNSLEISSVAFTFAPANDLAPDPMANRLRRSFRPEYADDSEPSEISNAYLEPLRLWGLLGRLMIDGWFGPPGKTAIENHEDLDTHISDSAAQHHRTGRLS
ncbi:Esterase [Candidatus Filomicrobium marinum]|uniref:Esterase n=2 Tax=Filomicrobium TaxID=119044 RepID=A0A0D6JD93_9HYPH|nr:MULTISPECIES: polyhydroxyalkanoate depolymerase [Filomicrobium]CFX13018.1 Esterase [Candidatus Filomicrobium marinum]CPR17543.1 Esterase [Candidatus Filomicrobium marinum]SDO32248.1 poly(3-hydroxybutyrate) depolymerase [Filomicrobium insigne]